MKRNYCIRCGNKLMSMSDIINKTSNNFEQIKKCYFNIINTDGLIDNKFIDNLGILNDSLELFKNNILKISFSLIEDSLDNDLCTINEAKNLIRQTKTAMNVI